MKMKSLRSQKQGEAAFNNIMNMAVLETQRPNAESGKMFVLQMRSCW